MSMLVVIEKSQSQGSSLLDQKMDPIREKNSIFFWKKGLSHWTIIQRTSNFQEMNILLLEKLALDNWKPNKYALEYSRF